MELANWSAISKRRKRISAFSQQARQYIKVNNVAPTHDSFNIELKWGKRSCSAAHFHSRQRVRKVGWRRCQDNVSVGEGKRLLKLNLSQIKFFYILYFILKGRCCPDCLRPELITRSERLLSGVSASLMNLITRLRPAVCVFSDSKLPVHF